jgi:protein-S-isoprenylcysteine O-methyltransferase Ste14
MAQRNPLPQGREPMMGDTHDDPIDHSRTTRQHAGETMKNGANAPGLVLAALGIVSMVYGLAAFAIGSPTAGTVAIAIAVVLSFAGGVWVFTAHRRVRSHEVRRATTQPDAEAPPPTS